MKVAINRCFGGFGLSEKAFEMLLRKKGVAFEKQPSASTFLGPAYFHAGHLGDNEFFLSEYDYFQDRADPDLISVIEQLGKEAEGWSADIALVEIPNDVQWHIHEYDGIEHIAENHRTWYGD
jgi:hypothetical protein